jgi:hypothetical protein
MGVVWSEHSERATLTTWAHAAGVEQVVWKQMARWQPSTDEGYLRSVRGNVEKAQAKIAQAIRDGCGHQDFVDEQTVIQLILEKMHAAGIQGSEAEERCSRLRYFGNRAGDSLTQGIEDLLEEEGFGPSFGSEPAPGEASQGEAAVQEESWAEDLEVQEHAGELACFVTSVVGKSRLRTLHKIGECHRTPGVHYKEFIEFGSSMPGLESYHKACRDCFPLLIEGQESEGGDSSDEDDHSSSDSSGD